MTDVTLMSDEELDLNRKELDAQTKLLHDEWLHRYKLKVQVIEERIAEIERGNNTRAFTEDELVYAASAKCTCGAGFAYPTNIGMHGSWRCSRILRGKAEPGSTHEPALPFSFYDIKSENQPSAYGATTRGAVSYE